eukprot:262731_1
MEFHVHKQNKWKSQHIGKHFKNHQTSNHCYRRRHKGIKCSSNSLTHDRSEVMHHRRSYGNGSNALKRKTLQAYRIRDCNKYAKYNCSDYNNLFAIIDINNENDTYQCAKYSKHKTKSNKTKNKTYNILNFPSLNEENVSPFDIYQTQSNNNQNYSKNSSLYTDYTMISEKDLISTTFGDIAPYISFLMSFIKDKIPFIDSIHSNIIHNNKKQLLTITNVMLPHYIKQFYYKIIMDNQLQRKYSDNTNEILNEYDYKIVWTLNKCEWKKYGIQTDSYELRRQLVHQRYDSGIEQLTDGHIVSYFGYKMLVYGYVRIYGGKYIFPSNIERLFLRYYDNENITYLKGISNEKDIASIKCKVFNGALKIDEMKKIKGEWNYNGWGDMFICLLRIPKVVENKNDFYGGRYDKVYHVKRYELVPLYKICFESKYQTRYRKRSAPKKRFFYGRHLI